MPGASTGEIVTPHEFFVIDQGKRTWQFFDKNTQESGTIECAQTASDRILVKIDVPIDKGELDWRVISNADGTKQFELERSLGHGLTFTWRNKLLIPSIWKVGDASTALSNEGNPATGNPIELKVSLHDYGIKVPKEGWGKLFPANATTPGWIQVKQQAKDSKLGSVLSDMTYSYILGVGPVYVTGQFFGKFAVLELTGHNP